MSLCASCPRYRPLVPSTGPIPARVLLLGEMPSKSEDRDGIPFTGPTGEELTTVYIPLTNLSRNDFHIANARQCSFADYHNPDFNDARVCANSNLIELLLRVQPEVIVPMGAVACSLFDGINLNMHHGILQPGKWGSWKGWIFPTFHPTAGMRTTSYMIPLMADFKKLGELLSTSVLCVPWDSLEGKEDYQVADTTNDLYSYADKYVNNFQPYDDGSGMPRGMPLGEDTESLPDDSPYCMTFSMSPGTGRLIYARNTSLLADYRNMVTELDPLHLFHNYLHDVIPFEQWSIPVRKFRDTMVMAYNLCLGGGGDDEDTESKAGRGSLSLKVLSYRHLAMSMTSFKDTVYPHSMPHVMRWMKEGLMATAPAAPTGPTCENCGHPQESHAPRGKTQRHTGPCIFHDNNLCSCLKFKKAKTIKAVEDKVLTLLHRKLHTIITNVTTGKLDSKGKPSDPWHRYKEWPDHDHEILTDLLGPIPLPSIAHVPEPALLNYAVRDPDATLRLYYYLVGLQPWIYYD